MQLEINGNSYGLIWGTRAFVLCERKIGLSLNEILVRAGETDVICSLTYCAIQNWFELQDASNVLPFTYDQFLLWLDDQPQNTASIIENSFLESTLQGASIRERYNQINDILSNGNDEDKKTVKKKKQP